MKKVVLLIGHNKDSQGALDYNGTSEYTFNKIVASKVQENLYGDIWTFTKGEYNYESIRKINPDLVIELHFNSYPGPIFGSECIVLNDEKCFEAATHFQKYFNKRFDISSREIKVVMGRHQRGYKNLLKLGGIPSFIFEPCFANFETIDSEKIIGNPDDYVDFLTDYISFYLGKQDKVNYNVYEKMIGLIQSWYKGNTNE